MHVGQVGLGQPEICGQLVVKPLRVDILGPESDKCIVRGFDCIRVATFEDGVNQFAGLCSPLCTFNFLQQCMKITIQLHSGFVRLSLSKEESPIRVIPDGERGVFTMPATCLPRTISNSYCTFP